MLIIAADEVQKRIEKVGDAEVVRIRDEILPLFNLGVLLGVEKEYLDPVDKIQKTDRRSELADRRSRHFSSAEELLSDDEGDVTSKEKSDNGTGFDENSKATEEYSRRNKDRRYHETSDLKIAVVSAGSYKYGMVVDKLKDSEEIVVKPLGRHLSKCRVYSGATIMGDGRVSLILDIVGLANMANLSIVDGVDMVVEKQKTINANDAFVNEKLSLLLFNIAKDERFAVPMELVERVERVSNTEIEDVGGRKVLQYRGGMLPLVSLENITRIKPRSVTEEVEVIVFELAKSRKVGLIVAPPVDSIELFVKVDSDTLKQPTIMGSAIINKKNTLLIDIFEAVNLAFPEWQIEEKEEVDEKEEGIGKYTVLFAEDSAFFRSQVKGYLEGEGFNVIEAEDGIVALEKLYTSGNVDIVVTDLEMPNMNGFELTNKIKNNERFSHLPVIAVTSLTGEEDVTKGKEVGIDEYHVKLDRDALVECLNRFLN